MICTLIGFLIKVTYAALSKLCMHVTDVVIKKGSIMFKEIWHFSEHLHAILFEWITLVNLADDAGR